MLEYRTTNIIDIYCGRIGLEDKQAECRCNSLKKISNGVYEVLKPVQFKAGEKILLDKPDKITLSKLEPTQKVKESVIKKEEEAPAAPVEKVIIRKGKKA
jgi:predicted DNA-binding antitoxin AbrB/MazE fold protein